MGAVPTTDAATSPRSGTGLIARSTDSGAAADKAADGLVAICQQMAGFTYVTFIVDVFSQCIVTWNAATTMATDLVMTPLRMTLWQRDRERHSVEPKSLISPSDAGSQGGFNRSSQNLTFVVTVDARPELWREFAIRESLVAAC